MHPVYLTVEICNANITIAGFNSIRAAEKAIEQIEQYDPVSVHSAHYGIEATEEAEFEYQMNASK